MKKFIKFLLWCVVIVLTIFALWKIYHFIKYTPWKKSHPQYYLTLKGHIDPKITKDFKFYMEYVASNCGDVINFDSGKRIYIGKTFPVTLNPDQLGNYEIKIPLDKFHEGFCGWTADGLNFKFKQESFGLLGFIDGADKISTLNVICKYKKLKDFSNCNANNLGLIHSPWFVYLTSISENQIITVNFSLRK